MENINKLIDKKNVKRVLEKDFKLSMKDKEFATLAYRLNLDDSILMKYTSKLENTKNELHNCKGCKGLEFCNNEVCGCVNYPTKEDDYLVFSYVPCKYKKEMLKNKTNTIFYETSSFLKNAKFSDIYLDDKARVEVLKYIKKFMKNYPNEKGLYLYGSFGSGKSYILNALLNELSKKSISCVSIYYPLLLKKLKDSFNNKTFSYEQIYNELVSCDVLLIDDIGAENNTPWARDEVLGGILQSRMDNNLTTFFTSNFCLDELENHLSNTASSTDKIKARRIIERIKQLCNSIMLVGENKRN